MFHRDLAKRIAAAQMINDRHLPGNPDGVVTAKNDLASRLSAVARPASTPERTTSEKAAVPDGRAAMAAAAAIEAVANHLD